MTFSSLIFLGWFLPFFLVIYYLAPDKFRKMVLLLFSLVFYVYGTLKQPWAILLMAGSVFVNHGLGILIDHQTERRKRKAFYVIGIIINTLMLFVYKYLGFFGSIVKPGFHLDVLLPLGISFYSFQAISYLSDIYRRRCHAEEQILNFCNYMIMFPQLIAGPIVRYPKIVRELHEPVISKERFLKGIELFILGLSLKAILADRLGGLWNNIGAIGYESISTPLAWLGIVAYSLELYFDFAGYSLMAMGLGELIGITMPENFHYPYTSTTMGEFWRRWHMTLGSWFRDYIYIPLGGNRRGRVRTYFNLFVVWMLTGLWHGAGFNFILWGLFLFLVIANERLWLGKVIRKHKWMGHIYMTILIPVSWMMFAITDMNQLMIYAGRLIGIGGENVFAGDCLKYLVQYGPFIVAGILCSTMLPRVLFHMIKVKPVRYGILAVLAAISAYMIYKGMNDPFMYFQF